MRNNRNFFWTFPVILALCSTDVFSATNNRAVVSRKAQISGKIQPPSLEGNTLVPSSQKLQDVSQSLKVANDISKTNLKNLSKYVECPAGKYLPAGGSSADACKDCREDHACAGSDRLMPNASMDQGIIKCVAGEKTDSKRTKCVKYLSKYVECPAGKYLPAGGSSADACKDCREDHACAGSDRLMPNASMDQGIIKCATGKKPNSAKTACVIGTGIKVTGIDKKRKDDIIAKKDGKEISDKSGDVKCAAGKYLPGGKKECKVCEGVNKYCPGGEFDFADEDQGIHSCPTGGNVNGNKSGCRIKLSKSSMYYGTGQRASNIQQQCWIIKDVEEYASCVLPKD